MRTYFREHAKRMRRRQHILRQLRCAYPKLPKGARIRFNKAKTVGSVVWRAKKGDADGFREMLEMAR
jgi:hypothetical protein